MLFNQPLLITLRPPLLAAATTLTLGCAPEPVDDEERAAVLLSELEQAVPIEVESITPEPGEPGVVPSEAAAGSYNDDYCTLEARPAALISVVDQHGRILSEAEDDLALLYTRREPSGAWSTPSEGVCIDEDCERWAIGYAMPGEYVVGAFACGDYELARLRVGETEDGCHVDTVNARIQLELAASCVAADELQGGPASCEPGDPVSPSVVAMAGVIRGDMVIPTTPEQLTLQYAGDDRPAPMDCMDESCTSFVSDDAGVPGEYRVRAELCGDAITREVTVEANEAGCDVQTEWVGLYTDANQCAAFDYQPSSSTPS